MSLNHAILGFLNREPMTGYDLKTQCFDLSVSNFWSADQAQIYRTLEKLESSRLVESQLEFQSNRPNRKLFRITEEGRSELRHWLTTVQPLPVHREPFLVQLYFAEEIENAIIVNLLQDQKTKHEEQLRTYRNIQLENGQDEKTTRPYFLAAATLDLGILSEETYIKWIDNTIEAIQQMPDVNNSEE